jgi:hypothetical protein
MREDKIKRYLIHSIHFTFIFVSLETGYSLLWNLYLFAFEIAFVDYFLGP